MKIGALVHAYGVLPGVVLMMTLIYGSTQPILYSWLCGLLFYTTNPSNPMCTVDGQKE